MIDFLDKYIKTVIITIFYMFRKVEEGLNILSRDMEYIYEKDYIKLLGIKEKDCVT